MSLVMWSVAVRVVDDAGEHPDVVLDVCLRAETIAEASRRAVELARERVRVVRQIPRRGALWSMDGPDERRLVATALHASSIDDVVVSTDLDPQEAML
jgi:hypothetical protein